MATPLSSWRRSAGHLLPVLLCAVACGRRPPFFSAEVAPIIFQRCAPCHRPGGAGPFSLLTYEEVARRAGQIARVTARGLMPPWKPVAGLVAYANERSLSQAERDILQKWAAAGAPIGKREQIPSPPSWPVGWQLGTPDSVVTLPHAFLLPADGPDLYQNFVIPTPLAHGVRFVAAWELRPDTRTIHHAIVNLDRTGWARAHDHGDGFAGMDPGDIQAPDGFYLVWAPGQSPAPPQPGMAWPLDEKTDLVLQLHLRPTGKPELVRPSIALYFGSPPTRPRFTLRVGDMPIDIPAGDARYQAHSEYLLGADVEILSLFPHAHYLARSLRSWATLPDGSRRWLLAIDDWDPAWQQDYVLAEPIKLPRGTHVEMQFVYDNSEGNVRNPNHPPKRVQTGERTVDEMGNITFSVAVQSLADKAVLREEKYRRQLSMSDSARGHYNLANALNDEKRAGEAIAEYRRALALDPTLLPAQMNLGGALLATHDNLAASETFRSLIQMQPQLAPAHLNLALALRALGDDANARREFNAALAIDPTLTAARTGLASLPNSNRQ